MIYSGSDIVARDAAAAAQTTANNAGVIAAYAAERGIAALVVTNIGDAYNAPMPLGVIAPFPDGKGFVFESLAANGGPVTINIGGTGAKEITHLGGASLQAGDIPTLDTLVEIFYDSSIDKYHAQLIRQPAGTPAGKPSGNPITGTSLRFARADHNHGSAIVGVTDGSVAVGGDVGEVISAEILFAAAIPMVSGVPLNLCFIDLPAGDWEINGRAGVSVNAGAIRQLAVSDSIVSGAIDVEYTNVVNFQVDTLFAKNSFNIPPRFLNLNVTTRIYLVCQYISVAAATVVGYGEINASRRR